MNCPRSGDSDLPVFPLVLSFGSSPPLQRTIGTVSLPMSQRCSATTTPNVHPLFLSLGLFSILSKQLPIVITGQLVLVIWWSQDGLLKVAALMALNHFAILAEQAGFIVLVIVRTFVSYEYCQSFALLHNHTPFTISRKYGRPGTSQPAFFIQTYKSDPKSLSSC